MKKILFAGSVVVALLCVYSCSNDFDLVDEWKDIPVVYGVLDRQDTAIYVRVEKAFLDPETSALEIAQIPDSLYYPEARVKLRRVSNDQFYDFTKVDGNLDGYPREAGTFANVPNWLYKLKLDPDEELVENAVYELIVNRDEVSDPVTATTRVVSDLKFSRPDPNTPMKWEEGRNQEISWLFDKENAVFFDVFVHFYYIETIDGVDVDKSFTWQVGSNITDLSGDKIRLEINIPGELLFQTISSRIDASNNVPRKFDRLELEVIGGGESFWDYLSVNNANTGITSSQVIPNFTNFSEGYGLFASTNSVRQMNQLTTAARDSLSDGRFTKDLNFQ